MPGVALSTVKGSVFLAVKPNLPGPNQSFAYEFTFRADIDTSIDQIKEILRNYLLERNQIVAQTDFKAVTSPTLCNRSPRNWTKLSDCPLEEGVVKLFFFVTKDL